MENGTSELNWTDILNKFSVHEGTVIGFCKENNIKKDQLYYHIRKLKKETSQTFHAIELKKDVHSEKKSSILQDIRIEIGNVNIFIPANDKDSVLNIVKELAKSC